MHASSRAGTPFGLHGNPFDGHTLGPVITELEQQTGVETRRIHVSSHAWLDDNRETLLIYFNLRLI